MDRAANSLFALVVLLVATAIGWFAWRRRRRDRADTQALEAAVERNLHLPPSLHPVIDPDICIGSLSCVKACPEGDILGMVEGSARLIEGSNCIGHGRCADECPVEAIRLVFGTSERGVDLPQVDGIFETSRPGVHIVGELGGMGLIKNAMRQGLEASGYLASAIKEAGPAADDITDVAIVGAGPAGIATALGCQQHGVRMRLLEQGTLGGAVARYPRQKVVMTETLTLPVYGKFGKRLISKEDLLSTFQKICEKASIHVEEGVRVTGISGSDWGFTLETDKGPVRARKVVLAVGRRGSPVPLGVPGDNLPKVVSSLDDPSQYAGQRVLVVGGGDSAVEAAAALAEESGVEVTLAYRGPQLSRPREANRAKIAALAASGRVNLLLNASPAWVHEGGVIIKQGDSEFELPSDYVISCLGGELPSVFLQKMGITVRRHHGTISPHDQKLIRLGVPARAEGAAPKAAAPPVLSARQKADRRHRVFAWALFAIGALTLVGLASVGWSYYLLPLKDRLEQPSHAWLKPSGRWGHGVGVVATAVMMLNFLYAVRKHVRALKMTGSIRGWMTFHVFVGFMSPLVIAFHAAFRSNNTVATATFAALFVVVLTGVVGRYVYGLVPGHGSATVEFSHVQAAFEDLKQRVAPLLNELSDPEPVRALFERAQSPPVASSLGTFLLRHPGERIRLRYQLLRLRVRERGWSHFEEFRTSVLHLEELRNQIRFFQGLKRFLAGWRAFHTVLAIFLVGMIALHIAVSLFLGYRWIFR